MKLIARKNLNKNDVVLRQGYKDFNFTEWYFSLEELIQYLENDNSSYLYRVGKDHSRFIQESVLDASEEEITMLTLKGLI